MSWRTNLSLLEILTCTFGMMSFYIISGRCSWTKYPRGVVPIFWSMEMGEGSFLLGRIFLSLLSPPGRRADGLYKAGLSWLCNDSKDQRACESEVGVPAPRDFGEEGKGVIFLDRDGVVIEDGHYLIDEDRAVLKKDFLLPLSEFLSTRPSLQVFVVSNQSGVGRGYFSGAQVEEFHAKLNARLKPLGISITEWIFCPYHGEHGRGDFAKDSVSRKPLPGMILELCERHPINLGASLMVGDQLTDDLWIPQLKTLYIQGCFDLTGGSGSGFQLSKKAGSKNGRLYLTGRLSGRKVPLQ